MGYAAVFGQPCIEAMHDFEILTWIQQRVMLASTQDGQHEIQQSRAIEQAIAQEHWLSQNPTTPTSHVPFDPERMTPDAMAQWVNQYS